MIQVKRTYDPPARKDGQRFLVERLWPRGVKKKALTMDAWMKEVAPSPGLRTWFGHQPRLWEEFQRRYWTELDSKPSEWEPLAQAARRGTITLLYSARDTAHNSAVALRDYLIRRHSAGAAIRKG